MTKSERKVINLCKKFNNKRAKYRNDIKKFNNDEISRFDLFCSCQSKSKALKELLCFIKELDKT